MHKKLLKLMLLISLVITFPVYAAECSYKEQAELNKKAADIKAVYEETVGIDGTGNLEDGESTPVQYEYFTINMLNVKDDFYIVYSNNVNNKSKTYTMADAVNGVISFEWKNLKKVATMTFKVYSSEKTGCKDQLLRTIYLTVPRFNNYYSWSICEGRENLSLCDKYVTTEEVDYDVFVDRVVKASNNKSNNQNTNTNNTSNNTINNTNNMNLYIYGGVALLAIIIIVVVIVIANKKRNRL